MLFEGTGKYFWLIFLVFFIVYITVKICLAHIFKSARVSSMKAFIPFYCRLVLTDMLDLKRTVFYMTLIPFVNLYYYYIIIGKLLEAYNMNSKEAIYFILIPMYKFPELVFKNPQFILHLYDNTESFIQNENILFKKEETVSEIKPEIANIKVGPNDSENAVQNNNQGLYNADTVFSNSSLEPDERKETTIEAKEEIKEKEVSPINTNDSRPKVCPNCGTKLEPTAKICFFCGQQIS